MYSVLKLEMCPSGYSPHFYNHVKNDNSTIYKQNYLYTIIYSLIFIHIVAATQVKNFKNFDFVKGNNSTISVAQVPNYICCAICPYTFMTLPHISLELCDKENFGHNFLLS